MIVQFAVVVELWGRKMLALLPPMSKQQRARLEKELAAVVQRAREGEYTLGANQPELFNECSAEFMSAMCLAGETFKQQQQQQQQQGDAPRPDDPGPNGIGPGGLRIKF
jgi:hypothetical protein